MDLYGVVIREGTSISKRTRKEPPVAAEYDLQISAQHHQAEMLAEAASRRLLRTSAPSPDQAVPVGRRLQTLLRRLAGAPTFA